MESPGDSLGAMTVAIGLRIEQRLHVEMINHLRSVAPLEGVGLLAGIDEEGWVRGTRFFAGTNIDASTTRYTMDPAEVLAAFRDIDARGWRLGAIVHSHPATPAAPSPTDLREAHYPDALLLIVSLAICPPETRCWRISNPWLAMRPEAAEVPVVVDDGAGVGR